MGYSKDNNRLVHTGLFKCTLSTLFRRATSLSEFYTVKFNPRKLSWLLLLLLSALETNLCVNRSCFTWLVVLSCHRNLKASKCWSGLSRKVKTFLETTLIQSKHQNLMIKVSIISCHNLTLSCGREEMMNENTQWSPGNIGRFFQFCSTCTCT